MADESKTSDPPAYVISAIPELVPNRISQKASRKSMVLFGYAVAITTALIVVVMMGGVYYYRSLGVMETVLKKYKTIDDSDTKAVTEDIEIDTVNNVVVFRLSGEGIAPGTFAVLDYTKSLTAIYDPQAQSCYLLPGIDKQIVSPAILNDNLSKNISGPTTIETLNYQLGSDYPISDKTMLPAQLKNACAVLPVYWMEKNNGTDLRRNKRGIGYCYKRCIRIFRRKICSWVCVGVSG